MKIINHIKKIPFSESKITTHSTKDKVYHEFDKKWLVY